MLFTSLPPCHTHMEHNDRIYKYNEMLQSSLSVKVGPRPPAPPPRQHPIALTATAAQRVIVPISM